MLLHVTDRSSEPLQSQIVRQIRSRILSGDLTEGTPLPSIRQLAKDVRVSVITVKRAYETLQAEGHIASRRGKGFFVEPRTETDLHIAALERFTEDVRPLLRTAIADGLAAEDIAHAVDVTLYALTQETER